MAAHTAEGSQRTYYWLWKHGSHRWFDRLHGVMGAKGESHGLVIEP